MSGNALREVFARFGVDFDTRPLEAGNLQVNQGIEGLQRFGRAIASAALVEGIRSFTESIREQGEAIHVASQETGLSAARLQEWRAAASNAGVPVEVLDVGFRTLARNATAATLGMQEQARTFRTLGVEVRDSNGRIRTTDDLMRDLADRLHGIEDPTRRAGLAARVLGDSGARLLPLFAEGAPGIERAAQAFRDLGGGMSDETIEATVALTRAENAWSAASLGVRSRIALLLLPTITRMTEAVTAATGHFARMAERGRILQAILTLVGIAGAAAATRTILAWAPAVAPLVAVGAVVLALVLIWEDLIVAIDGGQSVFQGFADQVDAWLSEWADPENGPLSGMIQAFQFLEGVIASTYNLIAQLTGALPELGDAAGQVGQEGDPESALAGAIVRQRREGIAGQSFLGLDQQDFIPDTFERESALREARRMIRSGTVPQDLQGLVGGGAASGGPPQVTQTVRIDRIDTSGLTQEQAGRMIEDSIGRALTRQADDTLDVLGGGA